MPENKKIAGKPNFKGTSEMQLGSFSANGYDNGVKNLSGTVKPIRFTNELLMKFMESKYK